MKELYGQFLEECRGEKRAEILQRAYDVMKNYTLVETEARCGLSAAEAAQARELLLVSGAYLAAKSERERQLLAEMLSVRAGSL